MSGLLPVVDALRALLVPLVPADTTIDESAAEPDLWTDRHLYVYESGFEQVIAAGEQLRHNFEITSVYIADASNEEPTQQRRREVTEELSNMRDDWLALQRDHAAREDELWSDLRARADYDLIRGLEVRGFAVRWIGYRFLPD